MATIFDQVYTAISARTQWEEKQRVWYQMRHDGLRRARKPFPNAADLHYPLIDGTIDKLKPFYYNQIFQGERLAEFVAMVKELDLQVETAADFFNYTIREETTFEKKCLNMADTMLLRGKGILKVRWDPFLEKICFDNVDPLYLIVPDQGDELEDCDFFTYVTPLTIGQYKRDRRFEDKSDEFINRIRGNADYEVTASEQDKAQREGLSYSRDGNVILIWETYEKDENGWLVHTTAPQANNAQLRKDFRCTYKMNGKPIIPFESFSMEVKDCGWYAPRGVAERLAPFEQIMCKMQNDKQDSMTYLNSPLFESDDVLPPSMNNFRARPGEVLPKGVKRSQSPQVPDTFDQELNTQRLIAESYIQMPESGLAADPTKGGKNGDVTATQVNYQASLASTGIDLRARIFRRSLANLYRKTWAIMVDHMKGELAYFSQSDRKVLPQQALAESYRIQPSGSPDSWNKDQRIQRALARKQVFQGDPGINQEELNKGVIVADDPRLVDKLLIPQGQKQAIEAEDEAQEISILKEGFPAVVGAAEDHATRIQTLVGYLQKQAATGALPDPVSIQRIQEHIAQHMQYLQQQNPDVFKQLVAQMQGIGQAMPGAMPEQPPQQMAA